VHERINSTRKYVVYILQQQTPAKNPARLEKSNFPVMPPMPALHPANARRHNENQHKSTAHLRASTRFQVHSQKCYTVRESDSDVLMNRLQITSLVAMFTLLAAVQPAIASTPAEDFAQAENTFKFQDYEKASKMIEALLYPKMMLEDPALQIKAHEYLAACHFWLDNKGRMEEEFTALLTQAPLHELDAFYYPPALITQFQTLKLRLIELHILDPEKARVDTKPECTITIEEIKKRSKLPMIVPFGVGQFVNGKKTKGALFLTGELVFLGMNIGAWAGAESLRGADGFYSAADADTARKLRIVQYVGLGAFVAVAVWGIIDAFVDFVPETKTVKVAPCPTGSTSRGGGIDGVGLCFSWTR
jgi:hypothetical protein